MDLQALLAGDARSALAWVESAAAGDTFNWHGFAEGAAANARRAMTLAEADAWAELSIRAYEELGTAGTFLLSAMHLRAWMIRRHGPASPHRVRDRAAIVEWFRRLSPMPLEDARREAMQLRTLALEQWSMHFERIRPLRAVKNRIQVLRGLDELPDDLRAWLALAPMLP